MPNKRSTCSHAVSLQMRSTHHPQVADWIDYIQRLHYRTMDLTLDRVDRVISRIIGATVPFTVISVAGTNGKGSLATLLESIFRCAGLRTGLYTSPHLVRFNERLAVSGTPVTDAELLAAFEQVEQLRGTTPLTFFEYSTALAIHYFQARQVDVAILEVGLGGRKDAVNVLDADIACITSIGTDHSQWLGPDRERIGAEKAGILRSRQLAVCTDIDLPDSIRDKIRRLKVQAMINGEQFRSSWGEDTWSVKLSQLGMTQTIDNIPKPGIQGACQRHNAAGAVTASILARKYFDISDRAIRSGIQSASLSGRLQIMQEQPAVLLDVAHNVESVAELRQYLRSHPCKGRQIALLSALADKPIEQMVAQVGDVFDEWHLCSIDDARGMTARNLCRRVQRVVADAQPISLHCDVPQAFAAISKRADKDDRIVVFGSFITVGQILRLLSVNNDEQRKHQSNV